MVSILEKISKGGGIMYIQDIIGELLYIGIVAEKGRCYGVRWKFGYKKILKTHIIALNELQKCLQLNDEKVSHITIKKFIIICKENYEIGKFYNISDKQIDEVKNGKNCEKVNRLMAELFYDLITEIEKTHIHKRKVYDLLCALHNLPRVYLGGDKETLCDFKQQAISEEDAIKYTVSNMNNSMRKKYQFFL